MLKLFIEISSIFVSFFLIVFIILRLPKEIVGLLDSRPKTLVAQKSINTRIVFFSIYLILLLIFLNLLE